MLMTVWFCMNSNTPSLAITMKGVSPLMRPEATSGSAVTPMLSAAAQHQVQVSPSAFMHMGAFGASKGSTCHLLLDAAFSRHCSCHALA